MLEEVLEQAEEEESEVTEYLEEVFPDLFGDEVFEAEEQDAKPLKHKNKNRTRTAPILTRTPTTMPTDTMTSSRTTAIQRTTGLEGLCWNTLRF